jgi:uncharacterized membrane protein YdbT with pleckstrin-like domain
MSYVKSVLQPDEQIRYITNISWVIFLPGIGLLILAVASYWLGIRESAAYSLWAGIAAILAVIAALLLFSAWFRRHTTEIAVTNRRIIYKRGFISRQTVEMQMDKVESVDVNQTIWGRIFGYGEIQIHGVGGDIEPLRNIDSPIEFRNHVTGEQH